MRLKAIAGSVVASIGFAALLATSANAQMPKPWETRAQPGAATAASEDPHRSARIESAARSLANHFARKAVLLDICTPGSAAKTRAELKALVESTDAGVLGMALAKFNEDLEANRKFATNYTCGDRRYRSHLIAIGEHTRMMQERFLAAAAPRKPPETANAPVPDPANPQANPAPVFATETLPYGDRSLPPDKYSSNTTAALQGLAITFANKALNAEACQAGGKDSVRSEMTSYLSSYSPDMLPFSRYAFEFQYLEFWKARGFSVLASGEIPHTSRNASGELVSRIHPRPLCEKNPARLQQIETQIQTRKEQLKVALTNNDRERKSERGMPTPSEAGGRAR